MSEKAPDEEEKFAQESVVEVAAGVKIWIQISIPSGGSGGSPLSLSLIHLARWR